jgi:mRNA interferase MazF
MSYKRGDVVLVLFPNSNLRTAKRRPALVVQSDGLQAGLPQVVVAMNTSNMSRLGPQCRVAVPLKSAPNHGSGLRTDSVIMTDNLATILHSEIDRSIGALADMSAVDDALRKMLGL